ncbi:MAG TPA: methyltransferase domain-containing protein [Vicinamibacterales bacterium]|nr:methyltransferase domain-containing protein [Vicinamibacterales bacterium]
MERALLDTRAAFDGVAAAYDRSNQENPILRAMRLRAIAAVRRYAPPRAAILDLGCGPGTDETTLAELGYTITAIDWSPAMVQEARARMARAGLTDRVAVHHLGIQEIERLGPARFDAAFSNFGPLNCVPHLPHAARLIANRLRPGGVLVASVIGRLCPWEIALYAARRDWPRLRVRFSRGFAAVPLDGHTVWTRYYSPAQFTEAFRAAGFERVSVRALGLFTPPPYMEAFARRRPALASALQACDDTLGGLPGFRAMGDHFLAVFRKVEP